ncbi:MAG: hypothetical protein Q9174_006475 [Haloplaca sp. 1 TL-2023]
MSGIEAASLALAVFPVLVNGINQMAAGIATIRRWKNYRLKLREFAFSIESAHVYFFDTLEVLLTDLVCDQELELLINDPSGSMWKDPRYEQKLRVRLGRSYKSYFRTVQTLAFNLKAFCERLGIESDGTVAWDNFGSVEREMKRFKMTLSQGVYKESLAEIRRNNKELREFTHESISLEPSRRKRQSKRPLKELKLIRKHAASLYQVLTTEKAWKCKCRSSHVVSLRLEARPRTAEEVKARVPQQYIFRVLLTVVDERCPIGSKAQWNEIEVVVSLGNGSLIRQPHERPAENGSESCNRTQRVRFALDVVPPLIGKRKDRDLVEKCIDDICTATCGSNRGIREIGVLIDDTADRQEHRLYRESTIFSSQVMSESLEDLLRSRREVSGKGLSMKARLQIAVVLASSVLQLDGTPWLRSGWSSGDIFFHQKTEQLPSVEGSNGQADIFRKKAACVSSSMNKKESYSHPYLSWQRCCYNAVSQKEVGIMPHVIRCDALLALGLILLELCFGHTMQELREPQDIIDKDESSTRFKTASRLYRDVDDEMGPTYGDVVRRCLFQPFDFREMSLELEEVQQKVLEDVVVPLKGELENFEREIQVK